MKVLKANMHCQNTMEFDEVGEYTMLTKTCPYYKIHYDNQSIIRMTQISYMMVSFIIYIEDMIQQDNYFQME